MLSSEWCDWVTLAFLPPAPYPADRDNFLSPKQAMELGIIDGVIA